MENGDPHTPSPLYSEAIINHSETVIDHGIQKTLTADNVDPHFARLLSSLTLSAKKTNGIAAPLGNTSNIPVESSPTKPPTSQVQPKSSVTQPIHVTSAKHAHSSRTPSTAPRASPTSSSTATMPRTPSRVGYNTTPPRQHTLSPRQSMHTSPTIGGHVPTSPFSSTRRMVPPVDISPYLQRAATAAPSIPKQLKYISMLENIVKESERMTPKIERQMASGQISTSPGFTQIAPTPIALSSPHYGHPRAPSVIYSSRSGSQIGFPPQTQPSYPQLPSTTSEDPFIARPRTSNAFNPVSYNSMSSRPSLSEEQLRLVMSLPGSCAPLALPVGSYPPSALAPQPINGPQYIGPLLHSNNRPQQPHNLRVIPPQQLQAGHFIDPPPMSAPAVSPTFNLPPRGNPANNAHLLSILNSPTVPRTTPIGPRPLLSNTGPS